MKYYIHPELLDPSHEFPFLEDRRWQKTDDPSEADYIPIMLQTDTRPVERQRLAWNEIETQCPWAKVLILAVYWADDAKDTHPFVDTVIHNIYEWIDREKFYIHTSLDLKHPSSIFYDILLRRTQALFHEQRWDLLGTHWVEFADPSLFDLREIKTSKKIHRTFLSPTRIYPNNRSPRMTLRKNLRSYFLNRKKSRCAYFTSNKSALPPQSDNDQTRYQRESNGSIWQPIHNNFYDNSLVSAYVETISVGPNRTVTEKTWDPLVKGHFILPFGYPGIIEDLEMYGIQFPRFINYAYDTVENTRDRFKAYIQELERLRLIPLPHKERYFQENRHILIENRRTVLEQSVKRLLDSLNQLL